MFLTTHAAAGIFISRHVQDPLAVFGLAIAFHFIMDFIPHGDEDLYRDEDWKINRRYRRVLLINAIDVGSLILLSLWAIDQPDTPSRSLMLIGILGSILPDFLSHFFPVIHQRFSWLFFVRWLYTLTKPTGLRYFVRAQNWVHNLLHHEIIHQDIPFRLGLTIQIFLVIISFLLA